MLNLVLVQRRRTNNMKELSFEEKLKRVEEIVKLLQNSEIDLEKSLKLFEEGHALIESIESELAIAKDKVAKLVNKDGSVTDF